MPGRETRSSRLPATALCVLLPVLATLLAHWYGLFAYFQQDDFEWLGLGRRIPLLPALLIPAPHGTWRPLSERAYFLILSGAFGVNPIPFRATVFATQFINVGLLYGVVTRLSGSRLAGMLASVGWTLSPVLVLPMTWTAAYYQVLGACCFLGAFYCFLRYSDTGQRGWLHAEWAVYILGFGVIETMFVYPFIAIVYAICCRPRALRAALWMLVPAAVYLSLRLLLIPIAVSGPYQIQVHLGVITSFLEYWRLMAGAGRPMPATVASVFGLGLAGMLFADVWSGRRMSIVYVAWFALSIAPMLLLPRTTPYYATTPLIGLMAYAGDAGARWMLTSGRALAFRRVSGVLLVAAYVAVAARSTRTESRWWYERSLLGKRVLASLTSTHASHPSASIFVENVDRDLYWSSLLYTPYRLFGMDDVFLPAGVTQLSPDLVLPELRTLSTGQALTAAREGHLRILHVDERRVTDVTDERVAGP